MTSQKKQYIPSSLSISERLQQKEGLIVTVGIAFITIAISFLAFSMPLTTTLTAEAKREGSYGYALMQEISYNRIQAESVVEQYEEHHKVVIPPTYTQTAYEALINGGLLNVYDPKSAGELISLYAHLSLWQKTYDTTRTVDATGQSDAALVIHAKNLSTYISSFNDGLDVDVSTLSSAKRYGLTSLVSLISIIITLIFAVIFYILMAKIKKILINSEQPQNVSKKSRSSKIKKN